MQMFDNQSTFQLGLRLNDAKRGATRDGSSEASASEPLALGPRMSVSSDSGRRGKGEEGIELDITRDRRMRRNSEDEEGRTNLVYVSLHLPVSLFARNIAQTLLCEPSRISARATRYKEKREKKMSQSLYHPGKLTNLEPLDEFSLVLR